MQTACWQSDYQPSHGGNQRPIGAENFRQVSVNNRDEVFVGGITSNRIIKFDNDLNLLTTFKNQLHGLWGIVFDVEDTMFVANFLTQNTPFGEKTNTPDQAGDIDVTVIYGEDYQGAQLMTLPSAGGVIKGCGSSFELPRKEEKENQNVD